LCIMPGRFALLSTPRQTSTPNSSAKCSISKRAQSPPARCAPQPLSHQKQRRRQRDQRPRLRNNFDERRCIPRLAFSRWIGHRKRKVLVDSSTHANLQNLRQIKSWFVEKERERALQSVLRIETITRIPTFIRMLAEPAARPSIPISKLNAHSQNSNRILDLQTNRSAVQIRIVHIGKLPFRNAEQTRIRRRIR